ncbi:hypothetical protein ACLMOV_00555 [Stenotrophomonas muris]|uniref:SLOG cluster 4 domain-containing protein n=1 Tax=Stenotrophomonas muris TaxID=2963283 RepID=UPI0039E5AF6B
MRTAFRKPPLAILGGADPGSDAFERAAGGQVPSVIPEGSMPQADWPATVVVPCGMGDARNLIMALAGDACIVSGGRACTISEVWLHKRPLVPLAGTGGASDALPDTRRTSAAIRRSCRGATVMSWPGNCVSWECCNTESSRIRLHPTSRVQR